MQPGDLVPNFTGLSCLAGEVEDFDSSSLNGLYTVLCFYEVIQIFFLDLHHPPCRLDHPHAQQYQLKLVVQGDFLPVSASFLRALASSLEGNDCRLVAISTDSVEAHRYRWHCNP